MRNHVVIMAGGIGSRFWPLSTPEYPKQFIDVIGCGRTLIQLTVDRLSSICSLDNFWIVTNAKYVDLVRQQIPGIPEKHILAEPVARNTAPCIAWVCWKIKTEDPEANVVVSPSDSVVMDSEGYRRVIGNALAFSDKHYAIVTIGIKPDRPETGYGYIETLQESSEGIFNVKEFREKPDLETARKYLRAGNYLWNSGIFIWNVQTIVELINKYNPRISALMNKIEMSFGEDDEQAVVEELFPQFESISIDYAVLEPSSKNGLVYTCPSDFGWSDLGNWTSLREKLHKDADGNAAVGNVSFVECTDCIAHFDGSEKVVLQGLDGYIISGKNGSILVCRISEEQRIKEFTNK